MNMIKRSLQKELVHFFELIGKAGEISKSAFSQRRVQYKPEAFIELNDTVVNSFYCDGDYNRWERHRLLALDGSVINLPGSDEINEYFGGITNQTDKIYPAASILSSYDILNEIIIEATIKPYGRSEYEHAIEHIKKFREGDLCICDRGYAAFWFFYLLKTNKIDFLIRISRNMFPEFWNMPHRSKMMTISNCTKEAEKQLMDLGITFKSFQVRLVKVELDNGETEVLVTSLLDSKKYPNKLFKKLYSLRWDIERNYNHLKNHIEVENFSGKSVFAIRQDFYANVFIENLRSIISIEAQEEIDELREDALYKYKVNKNLSLGFLKDKIIKILLSDDPQYIDKIISLFIQEPVPIRPGRHLERKFSVTVRRYRMNYRRAI